MSGREIEGNTDEGEGFSVQREWSDEEIIDLTYAESVFSNHLSEHALAMMRGKRDPNYDIDFMFIYGKKHEENQFVLPKPKLRINPNNLRPDKIQELLNNTVNFFVPQRRSGLISTIWEDGIVIQRKTFAVSHHPHMVMFVDNLLRKSPEQVIEGKPQRPFETRYFVSRVQNEADTLARIKELYMLIDGANVLLNAVAFLFRKIFPMKKAP